MDASFSPLLMAKMFDDSSIFEPENLLREGRRQRQLPDVAIPEVCLLDPDGDIVRYLIATDQATEHPGWACYHTRLHTFDLQGTTVGVVGCAVGAPFAVLVAEQLAASGCGLVLSITSSGLITAVADPPYFVIIDRALRDEGTSHHYLPISRWSDAPRHLLAALTAEISDMAVQVVVGSTWTTDAPYRETPAAIAHAESLGIVAVEMEAAGLYAYATARQRDVICVAHVTNSMATTGDDFEKGEHGGAPDALTLASWMIDRLDGARSSR